MGPRSSDRGYELSELQKNGLTKASMGPRSSDRGYANFPISLDITIRLQWVHGPQTVVMHTYQSMIL